VPRLATLLSLLLVALVAAGCGSGGGSSADLSSDEQKVADTFDTLVEEAQKGDEDQICSQLLSSEVRNALRDCNRVVNDAIKNIDTFRYEVEDVKIDGEKATARVEVGGDSDDVRTVPLVREDDRWKIAELPTPPSASS
jgi:hypothetical protein